MIRGPLLLLPGLLCDATVWTPVLSNPAATLDDIADCRILDYGEADSIDAMARGVLRQAPVKFALAGHSMGGRVALEVMRLAPARVTRLALLDTGYQARPDGAPGERERSERMALLALARKEGMRAMGSRWAQGMVQMERLADTALMNAILDMIERKSADTFAAQINALLHRPDATALLPQINCPTLILCGREDSWSPLARHQQMAALLPRATLEVIADCGHMSTMERPQTVAQAMRNWLEQPD
ncbi:MAG: alpha/beta hydrolase [Betaproteobacteria bacterium]